MGLCFGGKSEVPWWEEGRKLVYKRKRHDVVVSNSEKNMLTRELEEKCWAVLNAYLKSVITNVKQWFSVRSDFVSPPSARGHLATFGDIFGYHTWRQGHATGI